MSFPLDLRALGCTALLPSAATPYGCIFRTTARHERVPVRVLTRSVSDVGRSPVRTPWCILLPQAHQTRRAAVHHSSRPVASGCGKLCCHSTALICRCARRTGVRALTRALFRGRASTCRSASEAGPHRFLAGVRSGPAACTSWWQLHPRMSDSESSTATARPVPRGRIRRGDFPGSMKPPWIQREPPRPQRHRAVRVSHQVQLPGEAHGFSPSGPPPPVRHGRKRSFCPFAPCGALLPGAPFPSALPAAPGRVGDATGAATAAPPCSDSSSARSRTVAGGCSRYRSMPHRWTPSGPRVDRSLHRHGQTGTQTRPIQDLRESRKAIQTPLSAGWHSSGPLRASCWSHDGLLQVCSGPARDGGLLRVSSRALLCFAWDHRAPSNVPWPDRGLLLVRSGPRAGPG